MSAAIRTKNYDDHGVAVRHAQLLATAAGVKHRVAPVPPTTEWPWTRWRIEPLAELTPQAKFEVLLADARDLVLTPAPRGAWEVHEL